MDRTTQTQKSAGNSTEAVNPGISPGPTDAEVEAWADRVRSRRQSWVDGPTEEEKHEWQRRERARRAAKLDSGAGAGDSGQFDAHEERQRLQRRILRETRLATEGVAVLLATLPFRVWTELVHAGEEWEDETLRPATRRWVPFYKDDL